MSFAADLKSTLSQKWLREKLTLKERAELLWEITTDLDWDTYEKEDDEGNYLGKDLDKAMEDLARTDKEDEPQEAQPDQTFKEEAQEARNNLARIVARYPMTENNELRTAIDSLLIMFDQAVEKYPELLTK